MKLIELSYLPGTSPETKETIGAFLQKLEDKKIIELPVMQGYIVNRMLFLYMNACFRLMDAHEIDCQTMDEAMKTGTNMPMGPCELSDYIGNDISFSILAEMAKAFPDENYEPGRCLCKLVESGKLGRKALEGFYNY